MDKMKKFGKAAALAGVLGASALGGGENSQAKNYSFNHEDFKGNKQAQIENKIKEVAQKNNIDLTGLKTILNRDTEIRQTESVENQKFKFETKISFKS